jgi:osmotically-inducible protein OsmY
VEKLSQVFEAEVTKVSTPPTVVDQQAWAARIRRAVRRETRGGVEQLKVEIDPRGIHLKGHCGSFYCKQLAQQAAMRLAGETSLDNQIEVRDRS